MAHDEFRGMGLEDLRRFMDEGAAFDGGKVDVITQIWDAS